MVAGGIFFRNEPCRGERVHIMSPVFHRAEALPSSFGPGRKGPPMEQQANRLIYEKSPYLLQHAHNPVDWYPWKEEAFEKAASENKPIFLSIGYSTCHWCH